MYFQNKLFVKQVKSFYLLLDQDPFISCVYFTTKGTTSPSYVYSITQLPQFVSFQSNFVQNRIYIYFLIKSTHLKFLQRKPRNSPRTDAMKYINTLHSIITIGSSYIFRNNYDTYLQFHIVYCRDVIQHKVQVTTSQLHMMLLV